MGIREAAVQGLAHGIKKRSEVRDSGEERIRNRGTHVGERNWQDLA